MGLRDQVGALCRELDELQIENLAEVFWKVQPQKVKAL